MAQVAARKALAAGFGGSVDDGGSDEILARELFDFVMTYHAGGCPHKHIANIGKEHWSYTDHVIGCAHRLLFDYQRQQGFKLMWPETWVDDIRERWLIGDPVFKAEFLSFSGGKNYKEWESAIEVVRSVVSLEDRRPA